MSVKKKSGPKEIVDPKKFETKKIWCQKRFESQKCLGQQNFCVQKILDTFAKRLLGETNFEAKKNWGQKMLGPKKWVKNDRSKRIWAKYILWGKMGSQKYWP